MDGISVFGEVFKWIMSYAFAPEILPWWGIPFIGYLTIGLMRMGLGYSFYGGTPDTGRLARYGYREVTRKR